MENQSSANLILEYLKSHYLASPQELGRALKLTPQDVRYNLRQLMASGRIIHEGKKLGAGRGRPASLYRLSTQAQDSNLVRLVEVLLDHLLDPALPQEQVLIEIAHQLVFSSVSPYPAGAKAMNTLIEALNRQKYRSHWEARPSGPCVFLQNCPYAEILPKFSQLCEMDRYLIEDFTRFNVMIAHTQRDLPNQACQFNLKPR